MSHNGMKVSDRLTIKTESVLDGDEIVILPSGTSGTKTTLQSSQTADIVISFPSTSGTMVNDSEVAALIAASSDITTLQANVSALQSDVSSLQSNETAVNTSITSLIADTTGNTDYVSSTPTVVIDPAISTTTKTHTFWSSSATTTINLRFLATGSTIFLINETNGDIAVTYDYSTPSSNQALTTLRRYECLRITGKSANYDIELERTYKYHDSTAISTSGGTSTLTWLGSGSQFYNISGTGGTILLPPTTDYLTAQEKDTYLGKELIFRNLASGNLIVRNSANNTTYRTVKPNETYTSFKAGLGEWLITGLQGAESASNTVTYRNGYIPSALAGSSINLPSGIIVQDNNLKLLKNANNSANSNYGGYVQLSSAGITDNTIVSLNFPNTTGKTLVTGDMSTNGSPSSFTLTSGSVTYAGTRQTLYTSKYISSTLMEVTAHVNIKLTAISSPVNVALSIPTYINPTAALAGIKPSVAVRCNNVTVTGQVFAHVEYGTNAFILTAVNNGVESAISAAAFLQATSELNFSITYVADY